MKTFIEVSAGVVIAFILSVILNKISLSLIHLFNFLSLVVIYFALSRGEIFGACLGGFCGLIQDSFSLGIFGVAGLSKTITGFLAGYISKKIDVTPFIRSCTFIFILISIEVILWIFLYSFVLSERINIGRRLIFFQPLSSALIGGFLFRLMHKFNRISP